MANSLRSIQSVLLSVALLLTGHGLQLTLLPLVAQTKGWSNDLIALTGSAYYLGFVLGCIFIPRVIRSIGHIRTFMVFVAVATAAVVIADSLSVWNVWMLVRIASGWAMAGVYMVVESWLNERVESRSRGSILALYTTISLGAMVSGQLFVGFSGLTLDDLFPVALVFLIVAMLPIGLTSQAQPTQPKDISIRWQSTYSASQVGMVCACLSGIVVGMIWTLGAVYAVDNLGTTEAGSRFVMFCLLGGFIAQFPAGRLSDFLDRRYVILILAFLGITGASIPFATTAPSEIHLYVSAFLCGASAMPMYSICVAHANDNASGNFLEIASGMLIANAMGSISGPLIYSLLEGYVSKAYVAILGASFVCCFAWTLFRIAVHPVSRDYFEPYQPLPKTTTNAIPLDPRVELDVVDPSVLEEETKTELLS